ncbi:MAG TPA: DedA family protein [Gammaproteobacteria bacterium]|nr:DedA family protein [Gammaproteobacteria bacterium]
MTDIINEWGLWGLFTSAFISSTLLPGSSEAILIALTLNNAHDPLALLLVATAGNTLGGMSSWLIGLLIAHYWPTQKLLKKPENLRAANWLEKHGSPILLLSWLPVVGDPLCLAAGWLKIHFWPALLFITAGKAARYGVILILLR